LCVGGEPRSTSADVLQVCDVFSRRRGPWRCRATDGCCAPARGRAWLWCLPVCNSTVVPRSATRWTQCTEPQGGVGVGMQLTAGGGRAGDGGAGGGVAGGASARMSAAVRPPPGARRPFVTKPFPHIRIPCGRNWNCAPAVQHKRAGGYKLQRTCSHQCHSARGSTT
jgi:hypothetical protein